MQDYRNIFDRYWPLLAFFLGIGLVVFLIWGKFLLWFFAKAAVKIVGLALIGTVLFFKKFNGKNEASTS